MNATRLLSLLFVLGTISSASKAQADPLYQPKVIPMCRVTELKSGETGCSYNLDEVKKLFLADSELATFRAEMPLRLKQIDELKLAASEAARRGDSLSNINLRLQSRVDELTHERLACDQDLQNERAKPRFGSPFAWIIAGLAGALAAGVLVATR